MKEIVVVSDVKRWASRLEERLPDLSIRLAGDGGWPGESQHASEATPPAVVLTTAARMGELEGPRRQAFLPVVLCKNSQQATQAIQEGAFDILLEPCSGDELEWALIKALRHQETLRELMELRHKKKRLARQNERHKAEISGLWEIGKAVRKVTSSLDIEEILTSILWGLQRALQLDRVMLGLVNAGRGREEIKLALGIEGRLPDRLAWPMETSSWQTMADKKGPILVNPKKLGDLPESIGKILPEVFAKCPLIVKEQVLGTIMCGRADAPIRRSELRLLRIFSEYAAIAIQNGRLYYDVIRSEEELKQAHKKLLATEKMALIGQMAVSINHEINNPLCNISLITQTVASELGDSSPRMSRLLRDVDSNVERIQKVTRKISGMRKAHLTEYLPDQMMVDLQ